MTLALLKFENGTMAVERCEDPKTGKQYLRAIAYQASTGRTVSAPVGPAEVMAFATDAVKQALLADGHDEREIADLTWASRPAGAQ